MTEQAQEHGLARGVHGSDVPDRHVLAFEGELDIVSAPGMTEALAAVPADADLVVDLSRVTFVDSVALGALVSAQRRHAQAGTRVLLLGTQPAVRRVLQVTQLDRILLAVEDADAAPGQPA